LLPIYVDLEGKGQFLTPALPGYSVVGRGVQSARAVVPSVVAVGESFALTIRSEDEYLNRATGEIPAYEIRLGEEIISTVPAGDEAAKRGKLVDSTQGRRTRSILIMDDDHVILSAINPDTIAGRFVSDAAEVTER